MSPNNEEDGFAMPEETLRSSAPLFKFPYWSRKNNGCRSLVRRELVVALG